MVNANHFAGNIKIIIQWIGGLVEMIAWCWSWYWFWSWCCCCQSYFWAISSKPNLLFKFNILKEKFLKQFCSKFHFLFFDIFCLFFSPTRTHSSISETDHHNSTFILFSIFNFPSFCPCQWRNNFFDLCSIRFCSFLSFFLKIFLKILTKKN